MICTQIRPVYTCIDASMHSKKRTRVYPTKKDLNHLIKENKRLKFAVRKKHASEKWKNNNRRIVLEELVSFLDLMDDVVDILSDDEHTLSSDDFHCWEIPDELLYHIDEF